MLVGYERNTRAAAGGPDDPVGQIQNRYLLVVADVEDLAHGRPGLLEHHHAAHHVTHVGETTSLLPITVNRQGSIRERLTDKGGHDHAIAVRLPWTARVEATHHCHGQSTLSMVGQSQGLIGGLAGSVGPAQHVRCAEPEILLLGKRFSAAPAVDLATREDHCSLTRPGGFLEQDHRALQIVQETFECLAHDSADAHMGSEVVDDIGLGDEFPGAVGITDVTNLKAEEGMAPGNKQIALASRGQVVKSAHVVAAGQQHFDQMGSDESCSPGHECFHAPPLQTWPSSRPHHASREPPAEPRRP